MWPGHTGRPQVLHLRCVFLSSAVGRSRGSMGTLVTVRSTMTPPHEDRPQMSHRPGDLSHLVATVIYANAYLKFTPIVLDDIRFHQQIILWLGAIIEACRELQDSH
ncbi:uncharacterized protein [Macrobrachium rosenbergii]|uniref:uncharacterized protein n=1 Tax=Macrobrachium rosenbergii TaxID=79674 RepID=UPI0034D46A1D